MDTFNIENNKEYAKIDLDYTLTLINIMNKLEEYDFKLQEVLTLSIKILHTDLILKNGKYDIVTLNKLVNLITGLQRMQIEPHGFIDFIYAVNNPTPKNKF